MAAAGWMDPLDNSTLSTIAAPAATDFLLAALTYRRGWLISVRSAGVAQLVEHQLAMLNVAGSSPVSRST